MRSESHHFFFSFLGGSFLQKMFFPGSGVFNWNLLSAKKQENLINFKKTKVEFLNFLKLINLEENENNGVKIPRGEQKRIPISREPVLIKQFYTVNFSGSLERKQVSFSLRSSNIASMIPEPIARKAFPLKCFPSWCP